jgi:hypothetical protein
MMRTIRTIISVVAAFVVAGVACAMCYSNKVPSSTSCCDPDTATSQTKTTQDQAGQVGANTFCIGVCTNDWYNCHYQNSATAGCTASGSYSNVWEWQSKSTPGECRNGGTYYNYSYDLVDPTSKGETVKYINDYMNCQPAG